MGDTPIHDSRDMHIINPTDSTKKVTTTTDGGKERLDVDADVTVTNPSGATIAEGKISVGTSSTTIKVLNSLRLSLSIVNDSSAIVYVAKSGTAVINEGTRLNKKGGSMIIENYKGLVSAIADAVASNITFSEVATP